MTTALIVCTALASICGLASIIGILIFIFGDYYDSDFGGALLGLGLIGLLLVGLLGFGAACGTGVATTVTTEIKIDSLHKEPNIVSAIFIDDDEYKSISSTKISVCRASDGELQLIKTVNLNSYGGQISASYTLKCKNGPVLEKEEK